MEKENKYYVYAYLDPRKPGKYQYTGLDFSFIYEPFYIGKGKNKQMFSHLKENEKSTANIFKVRKINKIKKSGNECIIIKLFDNISEENAFELEKCVIEFIGRYCDNKNGPLTNILIGGSAPPKFYDLPIDKQKEIRNIFSNKKYSKETIAKRVAHLIGKPRPKHIVDELKKRVGEANTMFGKFKNKILQKDLGNNFIKEWESISEIRKNLGFSDSKISEVCSKKRKTAYGYIWEYKV